jgi:hypothetical protein
MRHFSPFAPLTTLLLLAALHACSAEPGQEEDPAPAADAPREENHASPPHEEAPPAPLTAPSIDKDQEGYVHVRIPWIGGTSLVGDLQGEDPLVPSFRVEDGDAPAPDFTALSTKQGAWPRYYNEPVYQAILDEPEVLVFDDGIDEDQVWRRGVFRWSNSAGARFETLPVPATYGAFTPTALIARATDDVWAGAAIKREDFEPGFPGCPSIVWASLDDAYLAHWDGRAWAQVFTPPGMGRLRTMTLGDDGTLTLETGWTSEEREAQGVSPEEAKASRTSTWTRSVNGVWKKE